MGKSKKKEKRGNRKGGEKLVKRQHTHHMCPLQPSTMLSALLSFFTHQSQHDHGCRFNQQFDSAPCFTWASMHVNFPLMFETQRVLQNKNCSWFCANGITQCPRLSLAKKSWSAKTPKPCEASTFSANHRENLCVHREMRCGCDWCSNHSHAQPVLLHLHIHPANWIHATGPTPCVQPTEPIFL